MPPSLRKFLKKIPLIKKFTVSLRHNNDNNTLINIMFKKLHIRALCLCMMLIVALAASAQHPQVTERLNRNGQVTVDAPGELVKRNNADLGKQQGSKDKKVKEKDKKKTEVKSEEEKFNELDEDDNAKKDEDKKKEEDKKKKEEVSPKKPKRNHTSQQTIESRGVGYRIQAYSDNNTKTAKAAAQQRARDIAMKFPQYRSYISYKAPSWRLRIGDFKTQHEAQEALRRIKSVYPKFAREMVIVRDRINVWSND